MKEIQVCTKCVQNDEFDEEIVFDAEGVCNYCIECEPRYKQLPLNYAEYEQIIKQIKIAGHGKKYDCIIGMSGGVDSSYVAHLCRIEGLRPLVVHFDNGWNTELAISNINNIINKCGFELHTLVVDWEEFSDLQRSLIRSSVVDIEMASDHAILATMMNIAKKHGIPYTITGSNVATESGMPLSWSWRKGDWLNMSAIHKQFGSKKLKSYPVYSSFSQFRDRLLKVGPKRVDILDYLEFKKNDAIDLLKDEYDWREYGGKHYESFFTEFYQAYILPRKFNVDKRIAHLSSMIRNGETTKEEAEKELQLPLYETEQKEKQAKKYFCKKIGFSVEEFDAIMSEPRKEHTYYKSDETYFNILKKVTFFLNKYGFKKLISRYKTQAPIWNKE